MCKNPLERPHPSHLAPEPNVTINMGSSTLNVSFPSKTKTCITKEPAPKPRQCLQELHSNGPFSIQIAPGSAVHHRKGGDVSNWHPPECQVHAERDEGPETTRYHSQQQRTLHVPPEGLVISLGNEGCPRANAPQVLVTSSSGQGCSLAAGNSTQLIIKGGEGCKVVSNRGSDNQLIIQSNSGCKLSAPSLVISGNDSGCTSGGRAAQLVIGGDSGCRMAPASPTKLVFGRNGAEGTEVVVSGGEPSGCALGRGTKVTIQTPASRGCKLAGSCKAKAPPPCTSRPTTPSYPVCAARSQRSHDGPCLAATTGTNGVKVQVAGRPGMQVSFGSPDASRSCRAANSDFSGHTESFHPRVREQCYNLRPKLDMHHNKPTISFLIASRMTQLLKEMKRNAEIRANTHPYYHS